VYQTGSLEVVPRPGQREATRPAEGGGASQDLTRLVEPGVRIAGPDREPGIERVEENEVERRYPRGHEPLAPAGGPGRTGPQEERDVRADGERQVGEGRSVPDPEAASEATEHGRGIRGATAQPRGHGRALVDPDLHPVLHPESLLEGERRAGSEVPFPGELGHPGDGAGHRAAPGGEAQKDLVAEVERRHEREDLVVAVGAQRTDAEVEVHLGRRKGGEVHPMALPRPTRPRSFALQGRVPQRLEPPRERDPPSSSQGSRPTPSRP